VSRIERAQEARRLRDSGLKLREIAATMGVAKSTVGAWLNDPDGSKLAARKDGYRGTCEGCGKRTDGSAGPGNAPSLCRVCGPKARAKWSPETLIAKVREWVGLYGETPTAYDWCPSLADGNNCKNAAAVRERFEAGDWPNSATAKEYFDGSWSDLIEAAGFTRPQKGQARTPGPRGRTLPSPRSGAVA
jgi:hypothetical protein